MQEEGWKQLQNKKNAWGEQQKSQQSQDILQLYKHNVNKSNRETEIIIRLMESDGLEYSFHSQHYPWLLARQLSSYFQIVTAIPEKDENVCFFF